ncbi:tubulin/FtsZ family protein [Halorussus amylolyticus]|uniref:tubulin/FtsZ family protein n=1 Tax=Halorussus amylolyticus TaxID=1126242 RepID=UPI00104C6ED3|nr:tubulin/FtsZ family protein [Halorussus amylolyticus]
MKIAAVGIGGAGGRIVDALAHDSDTRPVPYLTGAHALDSDIEALSSLTTIPERARHSFGHLETKGTGTDGDRRSGIAAIKEDTQEVRRALDTAITPKTNALLVVAGLGGGTGSGATPHLVNALREVHALPVYAVSVLPANHEPVPRENTVRGLKAIGEVTDAQIVFNNESWLSASDQLGEKTPELNRILTERLGALFAAGEVTPESTVGQRVVDASEIIATLDGGGLTTIGYATQELKDTNGTESQSLLGRIRQQFDTEEESVDDVTAIKAVESTLRRAVNGKLTVECDRQTAQRGLLVFSGPPAWLHGQAIADGRAWVSEEIDSAELRSGDAPHPDATHLTILALLTGVEPSTQSIS